MASWQGLHCYPVGKDRVAAKSRSYINYEIDQVRDLEEQYNQDLNQLLKDILNEASKTTTK